MVEDIVLPAARHLSGPGASDILDAALDAVGGDLGSAHPVHMHYRPGRDLVVRFESTVNWRARGAAHETLVAAATVDGAPPGTLPVEAINDDGSTLQIGVWRWPFDPVLNGLTDAVTPRSVAEFLGPLVTGMPQLTVLVYRPTQRVVVRVVDEAGEVIYLKAMSPRSVKRLAERHDRLAAVGLPVPIVLQRDDERGLLAMSPLHGLTVRDRLKHGNGILPAADEYEAVFSGFAAADLGTNRRTMGRIAASVRHAAMLQTVLPAEGERLDRLIATFEPEIEREVERSTVSIHGDLYEAQLVTGHGRGHARRITGVLDLDDAGTGDPLGDRGTVLAHLIDRLADPGRRRTPVVARYVRDLRRAFGEQVDLAELDTVIAAVLVGLATGPFRIQQRRWEQAVGRRLRLAERIYEHRGTTKLVLPR